MSEKAGETSDVSNVVVGNTASHHYFRLGVVIVGILGLVVVAMLAFLYQSSEHKRRAEDDRINYQTALQQSSVLRGEREYEKAMVPLRDYARTGIDDTQRSYALATVANIYEIENKNTEALKTFREAEKLRGQPDINISVGIARESQALGDTKTAIQYYKQTIALLNAQTKVKNPSQQKDIQHYKDVVQQLETNQ